MSNSKFKTLLLAFVLAVPAIVGAQTRTSVTGTVTGSDGIVWNTGSITATIVSGGGTSFSLTPCTSGAGCPIAPSTSPTGIGPGGTYSMSPWANASILPAGTTYTFTATINGLAPPIGTGPQTCTLAGVTLSGSSQTVNLTGCPALSNIMASAGGVTNFSAGNLSPLFTTNVATPTTTPALSFSLSNAPPGQFFGNCTGTSAPPAYCPAVQGASFDAIFASPDCGAQPNCEPVHDDTQVVTDATFTNTSHTVSCPNSDCNFVAGDVGKIAFGVVPVTSGYAFGPLVIPQGTITAVNSAQNVTVSVAANATSVAGGTFVWGTDDTTDLSNAWTAALSSSCALLLPGLNAQQTGPAIMLTSTGQFNTLSAHCQNLGANSSDLGVVISGVGAGTSFIGIEPTFSFSSCTTPTTCFPGPSPMQGQVRGITFTGFGNNGVLEPGCPASLTYGMQQQNYLNVYDVQLIGFGSSCTNLVGIRTRGGFQMVRDFVDDGFGGGIGIECDGGLMVPCLYNHVAVADQLSATGTNMIVEPNAVAVSSQSVFGPSGGSSRGDYVAVQVLSGGTWYSTGDNFITATSVALNGIQIRGLAYVNQDNFTVSAPSSVGAVVFGGGKLYAQNTIFSGTSFGLQCDVNTLGTNYFFDLGGNTFSGTQSIDPTCQFFGSSSITGVAQAAANITPSTGWGTTGAAGNGVSAVSGSSQLMQFTITAAGTPTLNPTVAITFPVSFLIPPICSASINGSIGSLTSDALATSSVTPAGLTLTASGTATAAQTYQIQVGCKVP